jgi:hypothetical protein
MQTLKCFLIVITFAASAEEGSNSLITSPSIKEQIIHQVSNAEVLSNKESISDLKSLDG